MFQGVSTTVGCFLRAHSSSTVWAHAIHHTLHCHGSTSVGAQRPALFQRVLSPFSCEADTDIATTQRSCLVAVPVALSNPPVVRSGDGPLSPRAPACFANGTASAATVALFLNASASNYGTAPGAIPVSTIATAPFELVGLRNATVRRLP